MRASYLIFLAGTAWALAPGPFAPACHAAEADPIEQARTRAAVIAGTWYPEWELRPVAVAPPATSAAGALRHLGAAEDPLLRRRAAEALAMSNTPASLESLLWALADEDAGVQEMALRKVREIAPNQLLQESLDILVANDAEAIYALDFALPQLATSMGAEFLRLYQEESLPIPMRRAAAYCLGRMRVSEAMDLLGAGMWAAEPTLATSCALALYHLRDTNSVKHWARLLSHANYGLRRLAIDALAEIGGREAFGALNQIAWGGPEADAQLIEPAIAALNFWPSGDSIPAMLEVMKRNPGYRRIAAGYLRARTGLALGDTAAEWQEVLTHGLPPAPAPEQTPPSDQSPSDLLRHAQFVPPELVGQRF